MTVTTAWWAVLVMRARAMHLMVRIRWIWKGEAMGGLPNEGCQIPDHKVLMNSIIWNCRSASKHSFQKRVTEMVQKHNSTILVVMETRVGGNRARKSLRDFLLMELFALMQLGMLVEYRCCGILTELTLPIWPALNKKFTSQLRYEFQMLFGFALLCTLPMLIGFLVLTYGLR